MDNKAIAGILYETADLLEIDAQDSFRIRSYRTAAQAIEALPQQVADLITEPKKLLEVPGIGKGMLLNMQEILKEGHLALHAELLKKYRPSMLELLKIQGLGPKTIALIWSAYQICDIEGVDKVTPAGSLRRGRDTIGDLDVLVTGEACVDDDCREKLVQHLIRFPGLMEIIAQGENKISFRQRSGMQVDVRLLPPDSFGAALQYFTGSKAHNVALRQRALKMGFTLSEYSLARLDNQKPVAGKTEEEIYAKLKLDYIPPELRENQGEIEAAEKHTLPQLIKEKDLQGDVHMHTVETDGRCTIEEMAEAARARGYKYMAITDHSKNLAFANGLDDKRALEHIQRIRKSNEKIDGIKFFAGVEVDIGRASCRERGEV